MTSKKNIAELMEALLDLFAVRMTERLSPEEWVNSEKVKIPVEVPVEVAEMIKRITTNAPFPPEHLADILNWVLGKIFMSGVGFVAQQADLKRAEEKGNLKGGE